MELIKKFRTCIYFKASTRWHTDIQVLPVTLSNSIYFINISSPYQVSNKFKGILW